MAQKTTIGVSFTSRVAIQRSLQLGRVKMELVENLSITRQILMARNPAGATTRVQLLFRDFIMSSEGQQVISTLLGKASAVP